ncbi:MAG TPA: hypothetical protein PK637_03545 [Flavobacteriales bacterium]|nr:hypothetical protein [Flavobacteriales bacterium]HRE95812.1 hypothetical protein [Flavobacteriales bacterium]HRJ36884.1 hypothetical protein [Flavobacteriales bacterium]HRJ37579.1 hypothetical protein [Flavobacteriales bacterium]
MKKAILIVMLVLNAIVLLGQLWPEGAPPFAGIVNLITLGLNLVMFLILFRKENLFTR